MTDWRPTADLSALRRRAHLYEKVRHFFAERGVLEVDTPLLAAHGVTEPNIACIEVPGHGWLQSSPEYHMKRLLAAGSGPIYQISHAFRDNESGQRHNREFTLLEWYRPGFDLDALMSECTQLLGPMLATTSSKRYRFRELFADIIGIDPLTTEPDALQRYAQQQHGPLPDLGRAELVDLLMASQVEAALPRDQLSLVHDYPGWAAALARTRNDHDGQLIAERFEIFAGGLELANGYFELTDPVQQAQRFQQDKALRREQGLTDMAPDHYLLAALEHGLPDASGVAVGLDRVLMLMQQTGRIEEVLAFPGERA